MLDVVIKGGTVVDGTGTSGTRADVGVRSGRIVAVGEIDEPAGHVIDADSMIVTPGFIDPHTHYDAQLFWDPTASPSNVHGVTTVIGGNCGFTLAPLEPSDADYLRRMMAQVEGMPLVALEDGVDWSWKSFGDYLARLEGNIGVNAGFMVGHCALRRLVMGPDSVGGTATPAQVEEMARQLHESIAAGGLGWSASMSRTHSDGEGHPVPSRFASDDEVIAMCASVRDHPGTSLEFITSGCLDGFSDKEIDLMVSMTVMAQRPLNWNVLSVDASATERVTRQLSASDQAKAAGGRIVALTMPIHVPVRTSFLTECGIWRFAGWKDVMHLPVPERIAKLKDPSVRARMDAGAQSEESGVFRHMATWQDYTIGDTYSSANETLRGRTVAEIAAERGTSPFDTIVDIVVSDDLRTILWPVLSDDDDESWRVRAEIWQDKRVLLGASDAGAHVDRVCGAPYTTAFLSDSIRGRKLLPLEEAVRLITDVPARLFGLRDRGRVTAGYHADLVVLDPQTLGADQARLIDDLPGGAVRLYAGATGVERVLVNGVETIVAGQPTGRLPGTIIRSGRDTDTPSLST